MEMTKRDWVIVVFGLQIVLKTWTRKRFLGRTHNINGTLKSAHTCSQEPILCIFSQFYVQ